MGPLQPNDGTPPVYSQFYVLDPDQKHSEIDFRFHNMTMARESYQKYVIRSTALYTQATALGIYLRIGYIPNAKV